VKKLLAASNMPYDRVNHRASYEFVLHMVRVVKLPKIQIMPQDDSASLQSTTACLKDIAQEAHLEIQFVDALSGDISTVGPTASKTK